MMMPRLWVSPPAAVTWSRFPRWYRVLSLGSPVSYWRSIWTACCGHMRPSLDRIGVRIHRPSTTLKQEGVPPLQQANACYRDGQSPRERVGVFVVKKDGSARQRLIVDARRANRHEPTPHFRAPPPVSLLPTAGFGKTECVEVPSSVLTAAMSDVKDCFPRLRTPRWLQRYLCLAPLRASELGVAGQIVDGVTLHASTMVHPCWRVAHGILVEPLLRRESGRGADRH